tara:strand:+ start:2172 stop:3014 length:843 start_codon:yes stop_codon:yes gene_type:complete
MKNVSRRKESKPKRRPPPPSLRLQGNFTYPTEIFWQDASFFRENLVDRLFLFIGRTIGKWIRDNNFEVNTDSTFYVNDFKFEFLYESTRIFKKKENPLRRVEVSGSVNLNSGFENALTDFDERPPLFTSFKLWAKDGTDVLTKRSRIKEIYLRNLGNLHHLEDYRNFYTNPRLVHTMVQKAMSSLQQILFEKLENNTDVKEFVDYLILHKQDKGTDDTLSVAYSANIVAKRPFAQKSRYRRSRRELRTRRKSRRSKKKHSGVMKRTRSRSPRGIKNGTAT